MEKWLGSQKVRLILIIKIMIDQWSGMPPFIEIEWENEKIVKKYSHLLWFDYSQAIFWTVSEIYKKMIWLDENYINNLGEITFEKPPKNDK